MIWNPKPEPATDPAGALAEELRELCGKSLVDGTEAIAEVAAAVEASLVEDGETVERCNPGIIVALASKALWAIGEARASRRLGLLGAGVIRPADWSVAESGSMWIVDVEPLCPPGGILLELQVQGSLDMVLDCMADVWDGNEGRGVLGLQRLDRLAGRLGGRSRRRQRAWSGEVLQQCSARLQEIGKRRGWVQYPTTMALSVRT